MYRKLKIKVQTKNCKYRGKLVKNNTIVLNRNLSRIEQQAVFLHELGHLKCQERKCSCFINPTRREYHAMLFAYNAACQIGKRRLVSQVIMEINEARTNEDWPCHAKAAEIFFFNPMRKHFQ